MTAKFVGEPVSFEIENQLLESAKNLYEPESRPKIAPPLPGTRKGNYFRSIFATHWFGFAPIQANESPSPIISLKDIWVSLCEVYARNMKV